jgi:N utilization substance protein A
VKALVLEVRGDSKGPQIVVSRSHPDLVRRLLELEVPELTDGTVAIVAIAREPGHRTKIAVSSNDANVDPKGACVGARGSRVRQVVNELRGEKVDVVQWRDNVGQFIAEALGPAKVKEVRVDEENKVAEVIVNEHQLSLAIGKEGQNARLAARLAGYKVDIRSDAPERTPEELALAAAAGMEGTVEAGAAPEGAAAEVVSEEAAAEVVEDSADVAAEVVEVEADQPAADDTEGAEPEADAEPEAEPADGEVDEEPAADQEQE